jgi:hypothetical protein
MTRPTGRRRMFLGAYGAPTAINRMTDAERHAFAERIGDAMAAALGEVGRPDGERDPDRDQPAFRNGSIIHLDPADDAQPD